MVVHTIFALIFDQIIRNVCVGDYITCNQIAHDLYGQDAFAIEVTQYPVQEGDKYIDREFRRYSSETEYDVIRAMPTEAQEIQDLDSAVSINSSDITDIQSALAEIYEMLGT